jgi:hypothetical protein
MQSELLQYVEDQDSALRSGLGAKRSMSPVGQSLWERSHAAVTKARELLDAATRGLPCQQGRVGFGVTRLREAR